LTQAFVVANDEGASKEKHHYDNDLYALMNSLFGIGLCKVVRHLAASKTGVCEFVDSMLNRGRSILSLVIMRVLAVDASLRNTGVAIVDANNGKPCSVYFGTIHNASTLRSSSCLVAIRDRLVELIREHEPDSCARIGHLCAKP
jgi:hypothetical protein